MSNPLINQIKRNITKDNIIKDIRNLFKKKKTMTLTIIRDIRVLFESDSFSINYTEYESNGDKDKTRNIEI